MKKVIFSIILGLACFGMLESCNQNKQVVTPKQATNLSAARHIAAGGRAWSDCEEQCTASEYPNCIDKDIVITPSSLRTYGEFQAAVSNGASGVADFFRNDDWSVLFPTFADTDELTHLQSGNYEISVINNSNGTFYFSHAVGSDVYDIVIPVKK